MVLGEWCEICFDDEETPMQHRCLAVTSTYLAMQVLSAHPRWGSALSHVRVQHLTP